MVGKADNKWLRQIFDLFREAI